MTEPTHIPSSQTNPDWPTLTLQLPGQASVVHLLKDEAITIGRLKENSIVLDNHLVSLVHARLTRKDGEFFLKDLSSTNGTWVNGQPVKEARLQAGDQLRFADVTGRFESPAVAPMISVAAPLPSGLRLARERTVETPVDVMPMVVAGPAMMETSVAILAPGRSPFWELLLGLTVFTVVCILGWRLTQGSRVGWQHFTDADLPSVIRRFARDLQGENSVAQLLRQQPWQVGGTAVAALLLAGVAWRLARIPPPAPGALSPRALAKTVVEGGKTGMWQRRALLAEQKAERAQAALRDGFVAQAAQLFKDESVKTLLSQREQLLQAQQCAAAEMAELERRLDELQSPWQARLTAYEQRIADLEKALEAKTEENQELIQAKIDVLRRQLATQRSRNRVEFN